MYFFFSGDPQTRVETKDDAPEKEIVETAHTSLSDEDELFTHSKLKRVQDGEHLLLEGFEVP